MAYYTLLFSPTGGTEHLAKLLLPEGEVVSLLKPPSPRTFTADDTVLAAVPSFAGRVPATAAERLRSFTGGGAKAVLLCAYGNREYDDTLSELQDIMTGQGFTVVAAVSAVTRHSIYTRLASDRPDGADMEDLNYYAFAIKQATEPLRPLPGAHGPYRDFNLFPYEPAGNDRCTGCGVCAAECPVGAIDPANPKKVPGNDCISCMRCIKVCPENARRISPIAAAQIISFLQPYVRERKPNELFIRGGDPKRPTHPSQLLVE